MVQINELSATMNPQNFNQMTRWVNTKEEHCCKIITTISGIFPSVFPYLLFLTLRRCPVSSFPVCDVVSQFSVAR